MSSLRKNFKTNAGLEKTGVWYETGETRIRLARAGGSNTAFNVAVAKYAKDNQRAMATNAMDEAKMLRFLMEVYAEFVVTEWETKANGAWVAGIESEDDALLEVSFDNILATFVELPDLFQECKAVAEGIQYFRQSNLDGITKN